MNRRHKLVTQKSKVSLSPLEEERFGMRTARAQDVSCETLSELLSFCERGSVKLLIARCVASDLAAVHAMQDNKFYLMDSLIYYERTFDEKAPASMGSVAIRAAVPGDADRVGVWPQRRFGTIPGITMPIRGSLAPPPMMCTLRGPTALVASRVLLTKYWWRSEMGRLSGSGYALHSRLPHILWLAGPPAA